MNFKIIDLKSLSIEELESLRSEIDSLIKEKFNPKYKEEDCFINPNDLSFGYILGIFGTKYEIVVNFLSGGDYTIERVNESYLDNCVFISQEDYDELYISSNDIFNEVSIFRDEKQKEIQDFMKSLEEGFKSKVQKMIKEYKND